MIKVLKENKFMAAALIAGLICVLLLCGERLMREYRNGEAALIMTRSDAEKLAEANDMTAEQVAEKLGVTLFTPGEVCEALNLWISDGQRYTGQDAVIGLVEDESQYSYVPVDGLILSDADAARVMAAEAANGSETVPERSEVQAVRVFRLIDRWAARYATLEYSGAEELENIFFRAITERNVRVVWMAPFVHSETGEMITNLEEYTGMLEHLRGRLVYHSITLGDSFSVLEERSDSIWIRILLVGAMWGVFGAFGIVWLSLIPRGISNIAMPVSLLLCVYMEFAAPVISSKVFAPAAAIFFACLAVWYMVQRLKKAETRRLLLPDIIEFLKMLLAVFFISLMGGLYAGAFEGTRDYMLAIENFSGVKVCYLAPLLYMLLLLAKDFYGREGLDEIRGGSRGVTALLALGFLAALGIYLLRSGDSVIGVTTLEQSIRNAMERQLVVRPRTKEWLAAWPCMGIAYALVIKGFRKYAWPFATLSAIGAASVVNTFCHARAPIWLSVVRSGLGLGFGIVFSCLILYLFDLKYPPLPDQSDRIFFDKDS